MCYKMKEHKICCYYLSVLFKRKFFKNLFQINCLKKFYNFNCFINMLKQFFFGNIFQ